MGSIFAIVSKSIFEAARDARGQKLEPGKRYETDRYVSTHKSLDPLGAGGDLFLVTARAGDALWLVAHLASPKKHADRWQSAPSTITVTDITHLIPKLRFANDKGLQAKPGMLGMSLQTPRLLSDADVALLRGAAGLKGGATKSEAAAAPAVATPAATPAAAPAPKAAAPAKAAPAKAAPAKATAKAAKPRPQPAAPVATEPGSLAESLAAALAALDAGDDAVALERLVEGWQRSPVAELVGLTHALSERAESDAARALRGRPKVSDDDWSTLWRAKRFVDIGALAVTFPRAHTDSAYGRAATLVDLPPDPRLTAVLHQMLRDPPFRSTSSQPTWNVIFEYALRHPDPATLAVVREVAAGEFPSGASMKQWAAKKLAASEKVLEKKRAGAIVADEVSRSLLEKLASHLDVGDAPAVAAVVEARPTEPAVLPTVGKALATLALYGNVARKLRLSTSGRVLEVLVSDEADAPTHYGAPHDSFAIALVDVAAGRATRVVPVATDRLVWALAPDDRLLALASTRDVHVVDVGRAGPPRVLPVFTDEDIPKEHYSPGRLGIVAVAFSRDSRTLFAAVCRRWRDENSTVNRQESQVVAIDVASGATSTLFDVPVPENGFAQQIEFLHVAEDERIFAATSSLWLVWDPLWRAFAHVALRSHVQNAPVFVDESALVWRGYEGEQLTLTVADARTGAERSLDAGARLPLDVRRGRVLLRDTTPKDWRKMGGPLRIVDRTGREVAASIPRPAQDTAPAIFSPSAESVLVAGDADIEERMPGAAEPTRRLTLGVCSTEGILLAPGLRVLLHGSVVHIARDGQPLETLVEKSTIGAASLSADGRVLYLGVAKSVRAITLGAKTKPRSWSAHTYELTGVVALPDGGVASASRDQLVILWNADGTARHRIVEHRAPLLGLALDPTAARVASAGEDEHIHIFDVATGASVADVAAPGALGPMAFAADGVHLAFATAVGLSVVRGAELVRTHALGLVTAVGAHPTRPLFVVATADAKVHGVLPDGTTRELVSDLGVPARALAFTQGGATLLVGATRVGSPGALTELALTWENR